MAGLIWFADDAWAENSSRTRFVFDFVIERLPDGPERADIGEWEQHNVLMLDLRDAAAHNVVDVLADQLPDYIDDMPDPALWEAFRPQLAELATFAQRQQRRNRGGPTY